MKTLTAFLLLTSSALAHEPIPDVSADLDVVQVKDGETLTVDKELRVSTLLIHPCGKLTLMPGADIIFLDRKPLDAEQMTTGLLCWGRIEAKGEAIEPSLDHPERSIRIRSENPAGYRGHCQFFDQAEVDLVGVELQDLGRTVADKKLDPVTNHIGRYVLHMHHCYGPRNPTRPYQFRISHCSVRGSPRWGIVLHNSHFGLVEKNLVADCIGAGIVTEEGNETGNRILGNVIYRCKGSGRMPGNGLIDRTDFAVEGAGIWLAGGLNEVEGNVTRECVIGLDLFPWKIRTPVVYKPKFPGADTRVPEEVTTNIRVDDTRAFAGIKDNDFQGSKVGVQGWNLSGNAPAVIGGKMKGQIGFQSMFDTGFGLEDATIEGEECIVQHTGVGGKPGAYIGPMMFKNLTLKGNVGIRARSQRITADNVKFETTKGCVLFRLDTLEHVFRDCTFTGSMLEMDPLLETSFLGGNVTTLLSPIRIHFLRLNGDPVANYRVFLPEQAPDYVPWATVDRDPLFIGSPFAGKTNAETFAAEGIATFGYVSPTAATLPGVTGFAQKLPSDKIPENPSAKMVFGGGYKNGMNKVEIEFPAGIEVEPVGMYLLTEKRWVKLSGPFANKHNLSFAGARQGVKVWVRTRDGVLMMR
jgi:hypothetical protein